MLLALTLIYEAVTLLRELFQIGTIFRFCLLINIHCCISHGIILPTTASVVSRPEIVGSIFDPYKPGNIVHQILLYHVNEI